MQEVHSRAEGYCALWFSLTALPFPHLRDPFPEDINVLPRPLSHYFRLSILGADFCFTDSSRTCISIHWHLTLKCARYQSNYTNEEHWGQDPSGILKRIVGHSICTSNFLKMLLFSLQFLLKLLPSFHSLGKQAREVLNFRIKRVSSAVWSTSALDYYIHQLLTYLSWQETICTQ